MLFANRNRENTGRYRMYGKQFLFLLIVDEEPQTVLVGKNTGSSTRTVSQWRYFFRVKLEFIRPIKMDQGFHIFSKTTRLCVPTWCWTGVWLSAIASLKFPDLKTRNKTNAQSKFAIAISKQPLSVEQ